MKRLSIVLTTALAFASVASLQATAPLYENDGTITVPPVVDATNVVNRGTMSFFLPGTGLNLQYFETANTYNFTNFNSMSCNTGFKFDLFAGGTGGNGTRRASANFNNKGSITASGDQGVIQGGIFFSSFGESARVQIWSTNVVNSGTIQLLSEGLTSITGKNIDLTRGHLLGVNGTGGVDTEWAVGTETNGVDNYDPFANPNNPQVSGSRENVITPLGTNRVQIVAFNPSAYVWTNQFTQGTNTNFVVEAVFVESSSFSVSNNVGFRAGANSNFAPPIIQLQSFVTNSFGQPFTNELYILDTYSTIGTNTFYTNHGSYSVPPFSFPTSKPNNFDISTTFPVFQTFTNFASLAPSNSDIVTTPIDYQRSNQYSIYEVQLSSLSTAPSAYVVGSSITNVPGRIEINAETVLNLERTRIESVNYASISSTNHFIGSTNAQIAVPVTSFNLGSTNGSLTISNLLAPVVPIMNGTISMYSARWTTTNANGDKILWFTTIVTPRVEAYADNIVRDLKLRSTNITISDMFDVTNTLLLDTERLTITTNMPGAQSPYGAIASDSTNIVWSDNLPRLNFFTNYGEVYVQNAAFFAGTRHSPYFDTTFDEPYQAMVNNGVIQAASIRVWANYFELTGSSTFFLDRFVFAQGGTMESTTGPIEIAAGRGLFANGALEANNLFAGVTLGGGDLTISNMTISSGADITLQPTNSITDGGIIAQNTWSLPGGFNLVNKPASGDLLGTEVDITITDDYAESRSFWAGENRGAGNSGYQNNVAIGHLVLDGQGFDTLFSFYGTGDNNAMYVDFLDLKNFAANNVGGTNYTSLNINNNMTIYYAAAFADGSDISSALNGANNGRLVWVPSFTGAISSKYLKTVPNQNGGSINAGVKFENSPAHKAILSWQAAANSTNYVYYCTNLVNPNWQLLTNFVQGSVAGSVSIGDNAKTNGAVYYKIRVDPRTP
jgi:hypothetical protein